MFDSLQEDLGALKGDLDDDDDGDDTTDLAQEAAEVDGLLSSSKGDVQAKLQAR